MRSGQRSLQTGAESGRLFNKRLPYERKKEIRTQKSQKSQPVLKEIAALVLAIAPKEQSNGNRAVICHRSFAPWRPTTQTRGIKIQTLAIAGVFLLPTMARQYSLSISSFRSPEKERIISDRDNNRWKSFLLNYENRNVSLASLNCQRWDTGL